MKKIIFILSLSTAITGQHLFSMEKGTPQFPSYLSILKDKGINIISLGCLLSGGMYGTSRITKKFLPNRIFSYFVVPFGLAYGVTHSEEVKKHVNKIINNQINKKD